MTQFVLGQSGVSSLLRVSVVCLRWTHDSIETLVTQAIAIPSAIPEGCESLDQTAMRIIMINFGTPAAYMEQLYTFDAVRANDRETHVTYLALFPPNTQAVGKWLPTREFHQLQGQSAEMLEYALVRLRAKLEYTNIAFHLMPTTFTLATLQQAYETILGLPLDKRNFRRRMTSSGMLCPTGEKLREGPHRPAELYRFSGHTDHASYLTPRSIADAGWEETT